MDSALPDRRIMICSHGIFMTSAFYITFFLNNVHYEFIEPEHSHHHSILFVQAKNVIWIVTPAWVFEYLGRPVT